MKKNTKNAAKKTLTAVECAIRDALYILCPISERRRQEELEKKEDDWELVRETLVNN